MRPPGKSPRSDPRDAVHRDGSRFARRERGHRSFWQSLNLVGMVGWPIALGAVGGALSGRHLDKSLQTGIRFTLMLLTLGVLLGSAAAWKSISHDHE